MAELNQTIYIEQNSSVDTFISRFQEKFLVNQIPYTTTTKNFSRIDFNVDGIIEKLHMKVFETVQKYNDNKRCVYYNEDLIITLKYESSHVNVRLIGNVSIVEDVILEIENTNNPCGPMIRWVYDSHMSTVEIPLFSKGLVRSGYPFIDDSIEDYIEEYINSDSSILILLGPPGTGKTSLIKEIIKKADSDAMVTYDPKIMSNESLFTEFMVSSAMFLVMEDADAFLSSRKTGNEMMHRFLNIGDGLVSTKLKKIIFSTNLDSVDEIDTALIRPGRCFDIAHFRPLQGKEIQEVGKELNIDVSEFNSNATLAELTSKQRTHTQKRRTVGFY